MKKNIITFILVGITVLSIYGCGNKGKEIVEFLEAIEATLEESEETYRTPEQTEIQQPEAEQKQWQVYIQPDMPEPFIEVLKQYEEFMNTDIQILNEDAWWDEFNTVDGERGDLLWDLCGNLMSLLNGSAEESDIESYRYSLTDLTGDGFPELIMGHYLDLFDKTWLYVVYYYSETEGIKMEYWSSYFSMSLYEDGIIEYISGGMDYTITYLRFQEETESWEQVARIIVDWDSQDDSESYYRGVNTDDFSDPENEPMSEEEYQEIIERYTAAPVELEWTPMFCGETPDKKADLKNDEPVTVMSKKTRFDIDGSVYMWEEYEYDAAGNMTKYAGYWGSDGSFWFGHEYEYDSKSKLTKDTYCGADGEIDYWNEYEYDNAGNQVKHIRYDADGSIHTWEEYEYDSAGNEAKYISYNADGSISYWEKYEYDSAGNQVKRTRYNADNDINYCYEYEFDSMGNQTKTTEYSKRGDIVGWFEWEYDSAGNLTKKKNNFDFRYEYEYEYDDAGNQTKYSYYTNGSLNMWYEYEYDSTGNHTKGITYNADGSIQSIREYEYDSRGNKTKVAYDYVYGIPTGHEPEHEWEYEWEYDSMGNLTKYMEYSWGKVFDWYEYEYIIITPQ